MLTPEYLNDIEFNEVVKLYNQLNIDITADIIERVSQMQEVTETTRDQLKILMQTNGTEIFNSALNNASNLTADTKKALKELYTDVAKHDMQGYKNLYEYRNKAFKLSETQYKIINQGLKDTNKTLKNLTNSIAFRSQQIYIEAVDRAYMQAMSSGISYTTAIDNAVQELAEKGITLKDKAGRNVQLETAVRRNVMSGIRETSNKMERDIEEYLGCDGYEVTAHSGARPSHAEEQGKQFAVNKEDAKKYGIDLWSDVEDLWHEYNCRHSYFGIILGVSEPVYNKKELKEMEEATVKYQGKEIPLYNVTQIQRQYENAIRKQKRAVQTLQKAEQDTLKAQMKLDKVTKEYNSFLKETGLQKDYSRIKVASVKMKNKSEEIKYKDVTSSFIKTQKYKVKEQQYYQDNNGVKYEVDGKNVILEPTTREKEVANLLGKIYGGQVNIIPRVNEPSSIKTPDYIANNEKFDLKQITGGGKWTIEGNLKGKKEQSNNFIIDITNAKLNIEEAQKQIQVIYNSKHYNWVDKILLIKNNEIIKVYKRN